MPRLTEDELIARYLAPLAGAGAFGLRDDAALATPRPGHDLVVTKDMLVAGVHFFSDDPPDVIARKALRVNLSDLAAKAATPTGVLLGLALPHDWTEPWLAAFCAGLADDLRAFDCPLLGGDTVGTPGPLTISITAFGEVEAGRMVPRSGARAGDVLFVTGTIGDAALGLRLRAAAPEDAHWMAKLGSAEVEWLLGRYSTPEPRLRAREALAQARAAMDVSDGFVGDLSKMLALEGLVTDVLVDAIPLSEAARTAIMVAPDLLATALSGGDDYEILAALPPSAADAFETTVRRQGLTCARIGVARAGAGGIVVRGQRGEVLSLAARRFDHFPR